MARKGRPFLRLASGGETRADAKLKGRDSTGKIAPYQRNDAMSEPSASLGPEQSPRGLHLDSWKEIAAYLKRDIRTVQRWEKREGLPVHRHQHDERGTAYAYSAEIESLAGSAQPAEQRRQLRGDGSIWPRFSRIR